MGEMSYEQASVESLRAKHVKYGRGNTCKAAVNQVLHEEVDENACEKEEEKLIELVAYQRGCS